jgi:hypothetical protein
MAKLTLQPPRPQPNLLLRKDMEFKNSSALVLNSLFWHSPSKEAPAPERMPAPAAEMQPEMAQRPSLQPQPPKPKPQNGFFNNQDFGKAAEGLGDLIAGLASGDVDSNPSFFSDSPQSGPEGQRRLNPSHLFSPNNTQPRPAPQPKQLDREAEQKKKLQEELERRYRPSLRRP